MELISQDKHLSEMSYTLYHRFILFYRSYTTEWASVMLLAALGIAV